MIRVLNSYPLKMLRARRGCPKRPLLCLTTIRILRTTILPLQTVGAIVAPTTPLWLNTAAAVTVLRACVTLGALGRAFFGNLCGKGARPRVVVKCTPVVLDSVEKIAKSLVNFREFIVADGKFSDLIPQVVDGAGDSAVHHILAYIKSFQVH